MDEPTVAVDPQSRNKILEGIQKLNEQGSTIIYTSHYMEEVEQICTRIAIMDHGRVIASGTTEELKKMIKTGETITVEAILLEEKHLQDIRNLSHVFDVHYENQILSLRCTGAQHNLIRLLNYLQSQDITFGRVLSRLPTLNDVFLDITMENSFVINIYVYLYMICINSQKGFFMLHLIKYNLLVKLRNFNMTFWPLVFPLILGTFFFFAFGNLNDADFETVQVAMVQETSPNPLFSFYIDQVKKSNSDLLNIQEMDESAALTALKNKGNLWYLLQ